MGGTCFNKTPVQAYSRYFQQLEMQKMKEYWAPIKKYKMKKLFEEKSIISEKYREKYIPEEVYIELFPQIHLDRFQSYEQNHKKRLYQIFDQDNSHVVNWNNFYSTVTLFYYAPQSMIAVILFMIFDYNTELRMTQNSLLQLLKYNEKYLIEDEQNFELMDYEKIAELLLTNKQSISIDEWITQSPTYIDYESYRKLFHIFEEQKIQKQLANNFSQMNKIKNEQKDKYIGYLINSKWFQSWRLYIYKQNNIMLNGFTNNITYEKSLKTFKSIKTKKSIKSSKTLRSVKTLKTLNSGNKSFKKVTQQLCKRPINYEYKEDYLQNINNYEFIYNRLGDKPSEIYNNILEGQFNQILKPGLTQNLDYVLVSEQIWKILKCIYGGYPEFRRTGQNVIQIYPKMIKLFKNITKGKIDYDSQQTFELSKDFILKSFITKIYDQEQIQGSVFFKTVNMMKWSQIEDLSYKISQLSSDVLIWMTYVISNQRQNFIKYNCSIARDIKQVHVGDQILYLDQNQQIKKKAVYLGQNKNEKCILHFKGQSYINDICEQRHSFNVHATIPKPSCDYNSKHTKIMIQNTKIGGISHLGGLEFINNLIIIFANNKKIKQKILQSLKKKPTTLVQQLASIIYTLDLGQTSSALPIAIMINQHLPHFSNFQFTMCQEMLLMFMMHLDEDWTNSNGYNPMHQFIIQSQIQKQCDKCKGRRVSNNQNYHITIEVSEQTMKYYKIIYVPFSYNLNQTEFKKYQISLPKYSTFAQFKSQFQLTAEIAQSTFYIITQIYNNNIIKNYSNAKDDSLLEDIMIMEDTIIYAYQLCMRLEGFVNQHYYFEDQIKIKSLRKGQLIDFQADKNMPKKYEISGKLIKQKPGKVWNIGKIVEITHEYYTHNVKIQLQHHPSRSETSTITINPENSRIATYPTQSYRFSNQYHIKVLQRFYSEKTNEMELCNIPFIINITSWMRIKELQLLIYQQIRTMIHDNYKFSIDGKVDGMDKEGVGEKVRISKQQKIKKFKDYLFKNEQIPFSIKFNDLDGRCSICYKIQKSQMLAHQKDYICTGCDLYEDTPIFWQINPHQLRICLDWDGIETFTKPRIVNHTSHILMKNKRKQIVQSLEQCIRYRLNNLAQQDSQNDQQNDQQQQICCNFVSPKPKKQNLTNNPSYFTIFLNRIHLQKQKYKKINFKNINFKLEQYVIGDYAYDLCGAIAIEGTQDNLIYKCYIKRDQDWFQYWDDAVKKVKKNVVQKICALLLVYRKWKDVRKSSSKDLIQI